ncbi:MAG: DUF3575 domain-containing protein [Bacteroidetes bacterium]|nr:MAG: DUF3575 domain-containing protein [Bacteroidota bacterium]REK00421.1 MAG: DUF3575 domain-containing protein [Bacteroidota bacterium]REK05072.1 MAG: DUF3575 domain-containing protein [Bacteroidota bacterium]REK35539.1 MAG: DUF3575 domain-containing protein [Bacteroidota bacterium]REK51641.1 MAG: DUF3575 domain-containing protein [Bacteroidota bacterium]
MKNRKKLYIFVLLASGFIYVNAQPVANMVVGANIIKTNLTGAAFSHYGLQYERVTGPNQSFAAGFSITPEIELPFKQSLLDAYGDNSDARTAIESMKFTKFTFTPEYRFYVSKKGAPKGFYIATFARYTNMSIQNTYEFTPNSGKKHYLELDGHFKGYGAGALFGIQYLLGNRWTIDWWIAGPFIGILDSKFDGIDRDTEDILTAQDEIDLENDIEDLDIPLWTIDAEIQNMKGTVELSGPFYGMRIMGLSIGFRL